MRTVALKKNSEKVSCSEVTLDLKKESELTSKDHFCSLSDDFKVRFEQTIFKS